MDSEETGRRRELYARRLSGMQNDALVTLLGLAGRHDVISFAGGLPDPATFRAGKLGEVARQVIAPQGWSAAQVTTCQAALPRGVAEPGAALDAARPGRRPRTCQRSTTAREQEMRSRS